MSNQRFSVNVTAMQPDEQSHPFDRHDAERERAQNDAEQCAGYEHAHVMARPVVAIGKQTRRCPSRTGSAARCPRRRRARRTSTSARPRCRRGPPPNPPLNTPVEQYAERRRGVERAGIAAPFRDELAHRDVFRQRASAATQHLDVLDAVLEVRSPTRCESRALRRSARGGSARRCAPAAGIDRGRLGAGLRCISARPRPMRRNGSTRQHATDRRLVEYCARARSAAGTRRAPSAAGRRCRPYVRRDPSEQMPGVRGRPRRRRGMRSAARRRTPRCARRAARTGRRGVEVVEALPLPGMLRLHRVGVLAVAKVKGATLHYARAPHRAQAPWPTRIASPSSPATASARKSCPKACACSRPRRASSASRSSGDEFRLELRLLRASTAG